MQIIDRPLEFAVSYHEYPSNEEDKTMAIVALRRRDDNTIYAYRCSDCQGAWKVYQNPYHASDCPNKGKPSKKQEKEVADDTRRTLASIGYRKP